MADARRSLRWWGIPSSNDNCDPKEEENPVRSSIGMDDARRSLRWWGIPSSNDNYDLREVNNYPQDDFNAKVQAFESQMQQTFDKMMSCFEKIPWMKDEEVVKGGGGVSVHCVPNSPMLEASSSFGSTSSLPSLANLQPIQLHEADGPDGSYALVSENGDLVQHLLVDGDMAMDEGNNQSIAAVTVFKTRETDVSKLKSSSTEVYAQMTLHPLAQQEQNDDSFLPADLDLYHAKKADEATSFFTDLGVLRLCDSGLIPKAYKLLMQTADSGIVPNITTYNILINGFIKASNMNGAFKLFKELQIPGHLPDSVTYGILIDGLQRDNREYDAFAVFEQMTKNGCTPSSAVYKSLMTCSFRRKKVSDAFRIWMNYFKSLRGREDFYGCVSFAYLAPGLRRFLWGIHFGKEVIQLYYSIVVVIALRILLRQS